VRLRKAQHRILRSNVSQSGRYRLIASRSIPQCLPSVAQHGHGNEQQPGAAQPHRDAPQPRRDGSGEARQ
jgi:hypothetical protein